MMCSTATMPYKNEKKDSPDEDRDIMHPEKMLFGGGCLLNEGIVRSCVLS
jgi:hypothetical protein